MSSRMFSNTVTTLGEPAQRGNALTVSIDEVASDRVQFATNLYRELKNFEQVVGHLREAFAPCLRSAVRADPFKRCYNAADCLVVDLFLTVRREDFSARF